MEQANAEPDEHTLDPANPIFCQEEAKINGISPDKTTWYPFLNKEVRI
jgi:hypothetical protein